MERGCDRSRVETSAFERVSRLECDIEWPPGHAAAYLIDGPEPILVDAGAPDDDAGEQLLDGLAGHGYGSEDVEHVVVTHPHSDHVGQVPALLDAGARLYAPAMVVEQLERDADDLAAGVRETAVGAGLPADEVDEYVEQAVSSLERNRGLLPPDRVDVAFPFDEPFEVGGYAIEPVHTPGHQRAHACFEVRFDDGDALFAGDALVEPFRSAALHAGLDREAYDAIDAFYRGLDRLSTLSIDRVFPGHGPVFDDYDRVIAATRDRLDELVADVEAAVGRVGPASPYEITRERVDWMDHPAPLLDTIGALGSLEAAGRVTHERNADGVRRYWLIE